MLKRSLFFSSFLFLFTGASLFWHLLFKPIKKYDLEEKKEEESLQITSLEKGHFPSRNNVQKDFWFEKGKQRLLFRIHSDSSDLVLTKKKDHKKINVVEHFYNVKGTFQDKLYYEKGLPFQDIRYFTAQTGVYLFSTHHFFSEALNIHFLTEKGHTLPHTLSLSNAFLEGVASKASFLFSEKNPSLTAYHLQAQLDRSKELNSCSE